MYSFSKHFPPFFLCFPSLIKKYVLIGGSTIFRSKINLKEIDRKAVNVPDSLFGLLPQGGHRTRSSLLWIDPPSLSLLVSFNTFQVGNVKKWKQTKLQILQESCFWKKSQCSNSSTSLANLHVKTFLSLLIIQNKDQRRERPCQMHLSFVQ